VNRLGYLALAGVLLAGVAYAGLTATVSCTGTGVARPALTVTFDGVAIPATRGNWSLAFTTRGPGEVVIR
jgi:hypothetical protein